MTAPHDHQADDLIAQELETYQQSLERDGPSSTAAQADVVASEPLRARIDRAKRCLDLLWAVSCESSSGERAARPQPRDLPAAVGRFQIQAELGSGGFGIVYLAVDPVMGRQVALKVPRIQAFASAEMLQRFQHEATAAAKLDHPNIVPVLEAGLAGSIPYIASIYYDGPTLTQWLARHRQPVPVREAAEFIRELAAAMHHAHARGVLHRDIKPSNILLAPRKEKQPVARSLADFVPKLMDFGLAKLTESTADVTKSGAILGTVRYMSPEQARGNVQAITTATDVYALGVCLYELLTGQPLFDSANDADLLVKITTAEPRRPRRLRGEVPADLETICLKCLAKDPKQRYHSAGELTDDLGRYLAGEPIGARPAGNLDRLTKWVRRHPTITVLLGVACLSLGLIISGSLWFNHRLSQSLSDTQFQRERAETQARVAMEHVYASDMAAAQQAWLEGNLTGMASILKHFEPTADQFDLRGAEWYYLTNLIDGASHVLPGHVGRLAAVTFSPDGRWLVSGGQDGTVRLWDVASRKTRHIWRLPDAQEVNAVAFSPDSQHLAAATNEGLVRRWDVASRAEQTALRGHEGWVADVCFSPDGQRIASAGSDRSVQLWDVGSGESRAVLRGHQDIVRKVRFILDGSVVASTSEDRTLRLWRASDGSPLVAEPFNLPVGRNAARPTDMAVSPDGQTLVVCIEGTFLRPWSIKAPDRLEQLEDIPHEQVRCVAFSADGRRLLFGANDSQLYEWDLQRHQITTVRRGHEQQVWAWLCRQAERK